MTMRDDRLLVTGVGGTREAALDHADRQADRWFGDIAYDKRIGEAGSHVTSADGIVILFEVDVEYHAATP